MQRPLAIFGGTFDPIHNAHLRVAWEAAEALDADVRLLPASVPPHRDQPLADARQRAALVRAALAGQARLTLDTRELQREGPSYTIDTLVELRDEIGADRPLVLLVGADAFAGLATWHRWRELFDLAHVVVAHRPGWKAPTQGPLGELMVDRGTGAVNDLHTAPAGRIYVHAVTQLEISSTELRQIIDAGRDPRFLVPDAVREIIRESGCYARPR